MEREKIFPSKQAKAKPFIVIEVWPGVIKFVSVFEVSKVVINKKRLELTILLTNGDKDTVKFLSKSALETALVSLYTVYGGVF